MQACNKTRLVEHYNQGRASKIFGMYYFKEEPHISNRGSRRRGRRDRGAPEHHQRGRNERRRQCWSPGKLLLEGNLQSAIRRRLARNTRAPSVMSNIFCTLLWFLKAFFHPEIGGGKAYNLQLGIEWDMVIGHLTFWRSSYLGKELDLNSILIIWELFV